MWEVTVETIMNRARPDADNTTLFSGLNRPYWLPLGAGGHSVARGCRLTPLYTEGVGLHLRSLPQAKAPVLGLLGWNSYGTERAQTGRKRLGRPRRENGLN